MLEAKQIILTDRRRCDVRVNLNLASTVYVIHHGRDGVGITLLLPDNESLYTISCDWQLQIIYTLVVSLCVAGVDRMGTQASPLLFWGVF